MAKNKGLGRGLDALFEDNKLPEQSSPNRTIQMSSIDTNPNQPRKSFSRESLSQLADSIAQNGLLQPILVRENGDRYEIIAGERRFRACKMIGMTEITAVITEADELSSAKFALIENIQREELNPFEEACAYKSLLDDFNMTQEELSNQIGRSRSAIANMIRLLELPGEVTAFIVSGDITEGHGRALLALKDREKMLPLAKRCIESEWSVRVLEEAVKTENKKSAHEGEEKTEKTDVGVHVDYNKVLEDRFTTVTGRRCRLMKKKGIKTFELEYTDDEDLENLLRLIAGDGIFDDL